MLNKDNKDEIIEFLKNRILELKHKIMDNGPYLPQLDIDEYGDRFICEHDARMFEGEFDKYVYELADLCDSAIMETTF